MEEFNEYTTKPNDEFDVVRILSPNKFYYYLKEYDRWFKGTSASKMMRKIGIDPQDWYDKYILKLKDKSERPKCHICGRERKYCNLFVGYRQTCSTECAYALAAKTRKESHPDLYEKRDAKIRDMKANGEWNPKKREWKISREKLHEIRSNATKKSYQDNPERREKQSRSISKRYEDPDYRKKMSEASSKSNSRPEVKRKKKERALEMWRNPTERRLNPHFKSDINERSGLYYLGVKTKIFSKFQDKEIHLDSLWERKWFIDQMNNPEVTNVTRSPMRIGYINPDDNIEHNYIPDFLVEYKDGHKELIEIKPEFKLSYPEVQAKCEAATKWCEENEMTYTILTEKNYDFKSPRDEESVTKTEN